MKKSKIGICVIILLLILSPWITHYLVTTPSFFGFITPENQDTWIGFFGAIIGGGATLIGVWWTIYSQEKQRKEDLAVQYKPLFGLQNITLEKDSTDSMLELAFDIENIGRGEAYNFKIMCNKDLFNSDDEQINNCFKKGIILPNDTAHTCFYIQINDYDPIKNIIINGHNTQDILSYNIIITIFYSNISNDLYKQAVHIPASYNKTTSKCRINHSQILYDAPCKNGKLKSL